MKYSKVVEAEFIRRPNRFIADAMVDGKEVKAHVKNTGRCRELLLPGARVYLEDFTQAMGSRKLPYSLIAVEKLLPDGEKLLINMDSQAPNKVVYEALLNGSLVLPGLSKPDVIKPEASLGNSRLDFYIKDMCGLEAYIEVKGVTLESNRIAAFPDAPTDRGIKHLNELVRLRKEGYLAYALFIIQMQGMKLFTPNRLTHPQFADTLQNAADNGVNVLAYDCFVRSDELTLNKPVEISFSHFKKIYK